MSSGIAPPVSGRTSTNMLTSMLMNTLQKTQSEMAKRQLEIATGIRVHKPSDAPADASAIQAVQGQLEMRQQWDRNLSHAATTLDNTDAALGDVAGILHDAKGIASSQIGIGSDAETRAAEASVIEGQIQGLMEIANRRSAGVSLFAGRSGGSDEPPFEDFMGGIRYTGAGENMTTNVGLQEPIAINSNGHESFGALSARVVGKVDLDPAAMEKTKLNDMRGVQGEGIRRGEVALTVNGEKLNVDLSSADTAGDVLTRVNDALGKLGADADSQLALVDGRFELTAAAGDDVAIADPSGGQAAKDLGIDLSAGGSTATGGELDPKLTEMTSLDAFRADGALNGELKITMGATTKVADFSEAETVRDMANEIDRLNMGLRLSVSEDGRGLTLITDVSGLELSIGEVEDGSTAGDLGLRTFGEQTALSDFQFGMRGVNAEEGKDDFAIHLKDGSSFEVNIDGAVKVADVIEKIEQAAADAGLDVGRPGDGGTDFNVGLAVEGNGLQLEDHTDPAPDGRFRVEQLGQSLAASDLGIARDMGEESTLIGEDKAKVRVESVFTHLMHLRDALKDDDESGIVFAADRLEDDVDIVTQAQANVGIRGQRVAKQQERSEELKIAENIMLSDLRDADLTESITKFMQLQQQLEASLRSGSLGMQSSLLDFLR